jgi:hypothetical protein
MILAFAGQGQGVRGFGRFGKRTYVSRGTMPRPEKYRPLYQRFWGDISLFLTDILRLSDAEGTTLRLRPLQMSVPFEGYLANLRISLPWQDIS